MANPEAQLLATLGHPDTYHRYSGYISEYVISPEGQRVLESLREWYRTSPNDKADWPTIRMNLRLQTARNPAKAQLLDNLINEIQAQPVKAPSVVVNHFVDMDYASKLGDIAESVLTGAKGRDLSEAIKIAAEYDRWKNSGGARAAVTQHVATFDPDEWTTAMAPTGGLHWKLEDMNVSLGPVRDGNLIVVAARPETGKTSFVLQEGIHMARQLPKDRPVLMFNNEEAKLQLELRALQALFNKPIADIIADAKAAKAGFDKVMDGRFILWSKSGFSVREAEQVIAHYNPGLIIWNVLPKVRGFVSKGGDSATDTARLAKLFEWARVIAIDHAPSIAVMQAGAEAEGQQWIYQHHLHGSKTDVAGEADGIITIGRVHDSTKKDKRYFHVPKNKLPGGPKTDPNHKHGHFEVAFNQHTCLYESLTSRSAPAKPLPPASLTGATA